MVTCSPFAALSTFSANKYPAYAIERVAEPAPSLAWTTSSPPNMIRLVRAARSASLNESPVWERRGRMVSPACPPITVTSTADGSRPWLAATKVFARQMSRVVTPHNFFGLYTPFFFRISAAIGTVELTGLEMIARTASGQCSAHADVKVATMDAFVLNKSSRVMPGFRGTPAGITTTSAPFNAAAIPWFPTGGHCCCDGRLPETDAPVGM
mmetsp:Transcript_11075/g.14635  ORF Transcript_11075/g.14635 Transcript_11075/m.14635 type:complete len:211 (-) Transcript_11075:246-878(-)